MTTQNIIMLADYEGVPQQEASATLAVQGELLLGWDTAIAAGESKKVEVGRVLNAIYSNGLAIAAAHDIDSKERKWTEDGRRTTVSKFAALYLPTVGTKKVSDWRKMAREFDTLEGADIDTSKFAPAAFLTLL